MNDIMVTVENIVAVVTVDNLASGASLEIEAAAEPVTIEISQVGPQGPPGDGGDLDPTFIIDGGNF